MGVKFRRHAFIWMIVVMAALLFAVFVAGQNGQSSNAGEKILTKKYALPSYSHRNESAILPGRIQTERRIQARKDSDPVYISYKNTGITQVEIRPMVNGKHWLSVDSILNEALRPEESSESAALSLYRHITSNLYHFYPAVQGDFEKDNSVVRLYNDWGYGHCSEIARAFAVLASMLQFPSRVHHLPEHSVAEVYYDNSWHMFDADRKAIYRKPDGQIASLEDIFSDLSLLKQLPDIEQIQLRSLSPKTISNTLDPSKIFSETEKLTPITYALRPQEEIRFYTGWTGRYYWSMVPDEPPSYSTGLLITPFPFGKNSTLASKIVALIRKTLHVPPVLPVTDDGRDIEIHSAHPIVSVLIFDKRGCRPTDGYSLRFENGTWGRPASCHDGLYDFTNLVNVGPGILPSYSYYVRHPDPAAEAIVYTRFQVNPKFLSGFENGINTIALDKSVTQTVVASVAFQ